MGLEALAAAAVLASHAPPQDRPQFSRLAARCTPLTATDREPLCDIAAQYAALVNPEHPKTALWVSHGTGLPELGEHGLLIGRFFAGILIASRRDIELLQAEPTEEQLSRILGYVESKTEALAASLPSEPLIVQARIGNAVVLEMLSGPTRFREAATRCREHGDVHVMTMSGCLHRRHRLILEEARDAKRLQGRPGRDQAEARIPR